MRLLVLGGTHHVGRAVVETALGRGDDVTTLTRGVSGPSASGAIALHADRTDPAMLRAALGTAEWDAVIDTWSGAPAVVRDSAGLLADRAGHYGYVSSRSVYSWPPPPGQDESGPVVDGDPADTGQDDYAAAKRGGELAAIEAFGDRALLARAGLIIGPYEIVGRMPWWLGRIDRGGDVLAPGPPDRPLQLIDCRDLAAWMLSAADRGIGGAFNTVSKSGHATMASLLDAAISATGSNARLVWVSPEVIESAGIEAVDGAAHLAAADRGGGWPARRGRLGRVRGGPDLPADRGDHRRYLAVAAGGGIPGGPAGNGPGSGLRAPGARQPARLTSYDVRPPTPGISGRPRPPGRPGPAQQHQCP